MNRCRSPHGYYFIRGIFICDRWKDFQSFIDDVGEIPDGLSIDRIDNSKGYQPGNVRFATSKEQARNRTTNHLLTINGRTKTVAEWCELSGVARTTMEHRLDIGRTGPELLLPGKTFRDKPLTFNGQTKNINEWAKELDVSRHAIFNRLRRGWSLERTLTEKRDYRHKRH